MATIPDVIISKSAQRLQSGLFGAATVFALLSFGGFSNGDVKFALITAVIAAGAIFIGSKIKTKKVLQRSTSIYR
jgi:hypothetical protein